MKDIRIDANGELRCWKCGSKELLDRRTTRAHVVGFVTVGVGALATRKKLRCKACGEYNQTGNAQPLEPKPAVTVAQKMSWVDRTNAKHERIKELKAQGVGHTAAIKQAKAEGY